ncbi:(2Fe-2S)-binding protein [Streptomyces cavernae]|uniref:(2Fe-2S)-binding protein n=1 Tax=Streptomyces cavernae TaxID=2259034 RepID=UPI000FEC00F4|nr:(2Fe-2S)-binding protein [Streptomyces cavernae]
MTDDQHRGNGHGRTPGTPGAWEPTGEYDSDATAFVQLPEGGVDELLAAPGHGYTPPRIEQPLPNPESPSWPAPPANAPGWPEPEQPSRGAQEGFEYHPGSTGQWDFPNASQDAPADSRHDAAEAAGQDVTGQWSIPVADGDIPDESGEFSASSLATQWGGRTPPATLPGGAAAPWAEEMRAWVATAEGTSPADVPEESGVVETTLLRRIPERGTRAPEVDDDAERRPTDRPEGDGPGPDGASANAPEGDAFATDSREADPHHVDPRRANRYEAHAYDADRTGAGTYGDGLSAGTANTAGSTEDRVETAAPEETVSAAPEEAAQEERAPEGSAAAPVSDDLVEPVPEGGQEGDPEAARSGTDDDADAEEATPLLPREEHPLASYVLRVNGIDRPVSEAWIGESLLYVLRERLGLAGAKDGCSQGECGACNVQVDGRLVASCLVPAVTTAGSEVRTVEGLAVEGQPSDVQRALARCGAVQCGFCVPGMAMTVHDLLEGNPAPTDLETRQALCGNLCRCSGYRGVLEAVREVVAEREAHTEAEQQNTEEARIPHQAGPGAGGVNIADPAAYEDPNEPYSDPESYGDPQEPYGQDGGQA